MSNMLKWDDFFIEKQGAHEGYRGRIGQGHVQG